MKCKCCNERECDTKCIYICCSYCHKSLGDRCHILEDKNTMNIIKEAVIGEKQ